MIVLFIAFAIILYLTIRYIVTHWNPLELKGKHVLITGAGMGIGRKMAIFLAKKGCHLILLDIHLELIEKVRDEILKDSKSTQIELFQCDVSNYRQVDQVIRSIKSPIDILINNAGVAFGRSIDTLKFEEMKRTIDVNVMGVMYLTKSVLPMMKKRRSGHIVSIASVMGYVGSAGLSDYCASKFAVVGFHESLRYELIREGYASQIPYTTPAISTTLICPSAIGTGMFDGLNTNILFKLFSGVLDENRVANRVIEAIKFREKHVFLPSTLSAFFPLVRLLPTELRDISVVLMGGLSGVKDDFKGRGSSFALGNAKIDKKTS